MASKPIHTKRRGAEAWLRLRFSGRFNDIERLRETAAEVGADELRRILIDDARPGRGGLLVQDESKMADFGRFVESIIREVSK